jgi:hypothetical protein
MTSLDEAKSKEDDAEAQKQLKLNLMTGFSASILMSLLFAFCYFAFPRQHETPAVLATVPIYFMTVALCPAWKYDRSCFLAPKNIALFLLLVSLVVSPVWGTFFGFAINVLPVRPSDDWLNIAILLLCFNYLTLFIGFQITYRSLCARRVSAPDLSDTGVLCEGPGVVGFFLITGLIAFSVYYASVGGYLNCFLAPSETLAIVRNETQSHNLTVLIAAILKPFLAFGLVAAWSRWYARGGKHARMRTQIGWGAVVASLCFLASVNVNRVSTFLPCILFVAVWSLKVRRISTLVVALAGAFLLVIAVIYGAYRGSHGVVASEFFSSPSQVVEEVFEPRLDESSLQATLMGPQYIAYCLMLRQENDLMLSGRSLLASALAPVPFLGRPFREQSGLVLYNRYIYGGRYIYYGDDILDQPLPLHGELAWNFGWFGTVGYFILGCVIALLQNGYEIRRKESPLLVYCYLYFSFCIVFLIGGNLAVSSQMLVNLACPAYLVLLLNRFVWGPARAARAIQPRNIPNKARPQSA